MSDPMTALQQNLEESYAEIARLREERDEARECLETNSEFEAHYRAEIARLLGLLREWVDICQHGETPTRDPENEPLIRSIGEAIGYGALMSTASWVWRDRNRREDTLACDGAEFVSGPCRAVLKSILKQTRAALSGEPAPAEPTCPVCDDEPMLVEGSRYFDPIICSSCSPAESEPCPKCGGSGLVKREGCDGSCLDPKCSGTPDTSRACECRIGRVPHCQEVAAQFFTPVCSTCGGSGKVESLEEDDEYGPFTRMDGPCPACSTDSSEPGVCTCDYTHTPSKDCPVHGTTEESSEGGEG